MAELTLDYMTLLESQDLDFDLFYKTMEDYEKLGSR